MIKKKSFVYFMYLTFDISYNDIYNLNITLFFLLVNYILQQVQAVQWWLIKFKLFIYITTTQLTLNAKINFEHLLRD